MALNEYDSLVEGMANETAPTPTPAPEPLGSAPTNPYDDIATEMAAKPEEVNPYDDAVDEIITDTRQKVIGSAYLAVDSEPEKKAKALELSKKSGLPVDVVERNYQDIARREAIKDLSQQTLDDPSVALAPDWFSHPDNLALAKDDLTAMKQVAQNARALKPNSRQEDTSFTSDIGLATAKGWMNLQATHGLIKAAYGLQDPHEASYEIAEANRAAALMDEQTPNYVKIFQESMSTEGEDINAAARDWLGSFEKFKRGEIYSALAQNVGAQAVGAYQVLDLIRHAVKSKDQIKGLVYSSAESLPSSAPIMAASTAAAKGGAIGGFMVGGPKGAVIGGTLGMMGGAFTGTTYVETGSAINELLAREGVDIKDQKSLYKAFTNPELMAKIKSKALEKGLATGTAEGLTEALAGRFIGKAVGKGLLQRAAHKVADVGAQAAGEAMGNFAGQYADVRDLGKIDFGQGWLEAATTLPHSFVSSTTGAALQRLNGEATSGDLQSMPINAGDQPQGVPPLLARPPEQMTEGAPAQAPTEAAPAPAAEGEQSPAAQKTKLREELHPDTMRASEELVDRVDNANRSIEEAKILGALGEAIKDSKIGKIAPDKVAELISAVGGDSSQVFVDKAVWDAYWREQGLPPVDVAAKIAGDGGKSYNQAVIDNNVIALPISQYVSTLATTEHFEKLLPATRTRIDGETLQDAVNILNSTEATLQELAAEAAEASKSEGEYTFEQGAKKTEAMPAQADPTSTEAQSPVEFTDSVEHEEREIVVNMAKEIEATGTVDKEQAGLMARLFVRPLQYFAKNRGLSVKKLFSNYPLRVASSPEIVNDSGERTLNQKEKIDANSAWLNWEPEQTKDGKYKGAPEIVKTEKDLQALRKSIRSLVNEGLPGRMWYEDTAKKVMEFVRGDVVKAEKFIQLLAVYSPNTNVQVNTMKAVRAYNDWVRGVSRENIHAGTGDQNEKARAALFDNQGWSGRKTDSFYKNLMFEIWANATEEQRDSLHLSEDLVEAINNPVTTDLWMLRAFGYKNASASDDNGAGKYSFVENETRRIAAELNANLQPGQAPFEPHQVQAAIWVAMKARRENPNVRVKAVAESLAKGFSKLNKEGKPEVKASQKAQEGHDKIFYREAMAAPAAEIAAQIDSTKRSFADYLGELSQSINWEVIPSEKIAPELASASPEVRAAYTEEMRRLVIDENGKDELADLLGLPLHKAEAGTGGYQGKIQPNTTTTVVETKPSGEYDTKKASLYARVVQYLFKQDAVPVSRPARDSEFKGDMKVLRPNGTTERSFEFYQDAVAYVASKPDKGLTIKGGKASRAVLFQFREDLTPQAEQEFFEKLRQAIGEKAGYTKLGLRQVQVVNYRDSETGLPSLPDGKFVYSLTKLGESYGQEIEQFGQYGTVAENRPPHDWGDDREGNALLNAISSEGSPDLLKWLDDRREKARAIDERYAGAELAEREREAQTARTFNQSSVPAGSGNGRGGQTSRSSSPLAGAPVIQAATGPDAGLVSVAQQYARENGIELRRQREYVKVDVERAKRIAAAYEEMPHDPQNPRVKEAYQELIKQTRAQYEALVKAGYKFTFFDTNTDPYSGNPWNAMRDLRKNKKMAVFGTYSGYGTEGVTKGMVEDNPMLEDTGLQWEDQGGQLHPVLANDLFRAVHDAFGHGLEGAGFRAEGEENAWQAHVRLFTGLAVDAITTETRGQNSWLNFGPYGEQNRTAKIEDTVFADQKVGLLPDWVMIEGRAADEEEGTTYNQSEAPKIAPVFYSRLEMLLNNRLSEKTTKDQVLAVLRDANQEERMWMGIDEFLKDKTKVSKKELLEFVQSNKIEIKEVINSDVKINYNSKYALPEVIKAIKNTSDEEGELALTLKNDGDAYRALTKKFPELIENENWAEEVASEVYQSETRETKYNKPDLVLPGGENYREILLSLPIKQVESRSLDEISEAMFGKSSTELTDQETFAVNEKWRKERDAALSAQRDGMYVSKHWPKVNVLAHVRVNDRIDSEGKRVLFVEEVQSDLKQELRKLEQKIKSGVGLTEKEQTEYNKLKAFPFDKNWHELAMKRIIRMAAEQGYDKVSWTTGEQQAQRYDLSAHIDEVAYNKESGHLVAFKKGSGSKAIDVQAKKEQIEDYVGKEVAEKILNTKPRKYGVLSGEYSVVSGVDLKVGGEGMKGFYDKIIPDFMRKFGKKFGASVGMSEITSNENDLVYSISQTPDDKFAVFKYVPNSSSIPSPIGGKSFSTREEAEAFRSTIGDSKKKVHSMNITQAMKNAALSQGFSLFQGGDTPRGSIRLGEKGATMTLNRKADISTILHEKGHYYLQLMTMLEDSSPRIKQDLRVLKNWWIEKADHILSVIESRDTEAHAEIMARGGQDFIKEVAENWGKIDPADDIAKFVEEHLHEYNARGVEMYFLEGKSPSEALRAVFDRIKQFMLQLYSRGGVDLDVELTDEVREVFSRMYAASEEVNDVIEATPQPSSNDLGLTGAAAERYNEAVDAVRREAEERLSQKLMDDYKKKASSEQRARRKEFVAQISEQVNQYPIYRLIDSLRNESSELKMDKLAAIQLVGQPAVDRMPTKIWAARNQGVHPTLVAEAAGFETADDLLVQLSNAPKKEDLINRMADEEMRKLYPDLIEEDLKEEAKAFVHNKKKAQLLRLQFEILSQKFLPTLKDVIKRLNYRLPSDQVINEMAEKAIGERKVTELRPHLYERAENKAAKQAAVAITRGDFEAAAEAKRTELLNHELYRKTVEAKEKVKKSLKLFKKITKLTGDEDLAKRRDMDLINTARAVLAVHGIGKADKLPAQYIEQIRKYDPKTYEVVNEIVLSATESGIKPFNEMTYNEVNELYNSVKALWDLSKTSKEMMIGDKKIQQAEALAELISRVDEVNEFPDMAGKNATVGTKDGFIRGVQTFRAGMRRVEHWVEGIDGKFGGPFRKYFYQPISDAATKYRLEKKKVMLKYEAMVKDFAPTLDRKPIGSVELGYMFKNGKVEIIGALLHIGNESNLRKLLLGRGWAQMDESGSIDTRPWQAFLKRMFNEGVITKKDMDFVQGVWDLFEEMKPDAQRTHKLLYGKYFSEITANPVVTPFGTYRGGYAPAVADPFMTPQADMFQLKELVEQGGNGFMFPSTGKGFTKSRVEYNAPLVIDLNLVPMHIDKVMRFTHLQPAVTQAARLLMNKEFRGKLESYDPTIVNNMLNPWLQRAASQQTSGTSEIGSGRLLDRFANVLRNRVSMQFMMGNTVNFLQNFTGMAQVLLKVKARHLRNALWSYSTSPFKTAEMVAEKSDFMKTRSEDSAREVQGRIDKMILDPNAFEKLEAFALEHGHILSKINSSVMDTITWLGAYEQAVESGALDEAAIKEADSAVRLTMGSSAAEDVSTVETVRPVLKLFMMFYSYFNNSANLMGTEFEKVRQEVGLRKGAGRLFYIYTMGLMVPAALSEILFSAMAGKIDDDDDDEYIDDLLAKFFGGQLKMAGAAIPLVGQVGQSVFNAFNDKPYDDRISLSPAISALESTVKSPASVYEAIAEKGKTKRGVRDGLLTLGLLTGLPVGVISRPAAYLSDVNDGKAKPKGPVDFTRGLVSGKPGDR